MYQKSTFLMCMASLVANLGQNATFEDFEFVLEFLPPNTIHLRIH